MKYTLAQLKAKMAAEWTANNPVLAAGVPGFELDTYKFKIGDGSTAWINLAYFSGSNLPLPGHTGVILSDNGAGGYAYSDNLHWDNTNKILYVGNIGGSDLCAIYNTGVVDALAFNTHACRRKFKKNIKKFKRDALEIINATAIKEFNFKSDKEKKYRVGFIADDTDPILSGENQDGFDLNNTIGVLLKAVQELSAKVKKLEKEKIDGRA